MGDLIGKTVAGELFYFGEEEIEVFRQLGEDASGISNAEKAALLSDALRLNILYMIARAGSGHIGSSFSSVDIMTWLFNFEMTGHDTNKAIDDGDLFFSSKGHDAPALYSVLQAQGLLSFDLLHGLRRIEGLPGHPHVETPGVVTNTGALGMGVSKAKGMLHASAASGNNRRIYVMTGDGELQEGQFWESLPYAANEGLSNITVLVDHNKIQSDTWVENVSNLGDLEAKFSAFGWHVQRIDGHDFTSLEQALNAARSDTRPSAIICDTIKGKGVSFMQSTAMTPDQVLYGYHSGAPDKDEYAAGLDEIVSRLTAGLKRIGKSMPELQKIEIAAPEVSNSSNMVQQSLIGAWDRALLDLASRDERVQALDADLMLDCGLVTFREKFPERFIECGIAEQDMVSMAGGMALGGMLPVVHSFSCFLTTRANEQIYNNASEGSQVIYMGALSGLLPGGPGHSHQSVRDISCLGSMPGMIMAEPATEAETGALLNLLADEHNGPSFVRLVSIPCYLPANLPSPDEYVFGQGYLLETGKDVLVISSGPVMLGLALEAAAELGSQNIDAGVCNLPWLNKIDESWLLDLVSEYDRVVCLDNHYSLGGQGSVIAQILAAQGTVKPVTVMGIDELPACGTNDEVLAYHHMDVASLVRRISALTTAKSA